MTAQRAYTGLTIGVAHRGCARRQIVELRQWFINSGRAEAPLVFCLISVRSFHEGIPR
ncbi:MAG: hypothetical protein M3008_00085 [Chloroflexota bacterium]|nr:hypothetical protein [Chloroflexota bacterium]